MGTLNIAKIKARLENIPQGFADEVAQVGWFESAKYPDGTPVAYVASIQEYGAPGQGIPPRPTIKPTVEAKKGEWSKLMAKGVKAVIEGRMDAHGVLEGVGLQAAGDIGQAIAQVSEPPLSKVTLLLRKWRREGREITGKTVGEAHAAIARGEDVSGVNADPLRDTGLLIASLTNIVGPQP